MPRHEADFLLLSRVHWHILLQKHYLMEWKCDQVA